jgi:phosphoenolpyruvate carboxykinase (GTP)
VFGGRRATTAPLVLEAKDWLHGVFMGATMGSETTAAAAGRVGVVRRDPMAMLPFAGYNIGDYWRHWLAMQPRIADPPRIFMVNWFRKDANGVFLWPGYGENLRVLKWILARIDGRVEGRETFLGKVPEPAELDLSGLNIAPEQLCQALAVDRDEWKAELASAGEFFDRIGRSVPEQLRELHRGLTTALETDRA